MRIVKKEAQARESCFLRPATDEAHRQPVLHPLGSRTKYFLSSLKVTMHAPGVLTHWRAPAQHERSLGPVLSVRAVGAEKGIKVK